MNSSAAYALGMTVSVCVHVCVLLFAKNVRKSIKKKLIWGGGELVGAPIRILPIVLGMDMLNEVDFEHSGRHAWGL